MKESESSLNKIFGDAAEPPGDDNRPVDQPVTRQQLDDLIKRLSTPRLAADFTPSGSVTRQIRTEQDQATMAQIEAIRRRLESRRNEAKEAFERAHGYAAGKPNRGHRRS